MRRLYLFAVILLCIGFVLAVLSLVFDGVRTGLSELGGGIFSGASSLITGTTLGFMQWGAESFTNSAVIILGLVVTTLIATTILTRTLWPRIKTVIRKTPTQPMVHQVAPSMGTPIQYAPAKQTVQSAPAPVKVEESKQ